ncbi:hypothetical protein GGR26_001965 [Lewinella marina]|uniref:Uncharacterized protein n=1 Tax=Neolewinella marina TaxID=438751 RepID=A0A2G0CHD4_9BACT|nr:DUF5682 family protein [Neolewinella marina]NJB86197.1 hypothetical protein [Neolewinella marina]PHK99327.1 hypothetical protein CGL56_07700 [Neolewinella marina]
MQLRTFGIRHHGPGSARRLRDVLDRWQPDLILLEMPADSQPVLRQLTTRGMHPPLALVLYDAKDIERASFFPFARFSPEYQAIDWAGQHGVELRAIDLPARHFLAVREEEKFILFPTEEPDTPSRLPGKSRRELARQLRTDPLSVVAELAGYPDSESWWDATLERSNEGADATFEAILEVVTELRQTFPEASNDENEQREAYMRNEIRKALRESHERVAIVVGAWHGPAVADTPERKASTDKAILRGLPKVKVSQAWVPWSFPRLARSGGYGAGVTSPAWYATLFDFPAQAVDRWMAAAAQLLREAGFEGSPAMATEAAGLATTLATLRDHERPGIEELEAAVLTTLAAGQRERLELIHQRLTVGTEVGFVPPDVTTVPLLEDLRAEIKSTRMTKWWETAGQHYLKATKSDPRGGIDLRTPNDLRKSHLLHRLNLLDIHWAKLQPEGPDSLSSFKEVWLLEWQPEFSLLVIERGSYGNTVASAAAAYTLEKAAALTMVKPLAELTLRGLQAGLPEVVPALMKLLRARAAETTDVVALLSTLPALVQTSRYGDSRKTDTTALLLVIDELLPRLTAGLPAAATHIDDERGHQLVELIAAAHYHLAQLDNDSLDTLWIDGLTRTSTAGVHPAVEGHCLRLLTDRAVISGSTAADRFSRALSRSRGAQPVAEWIYGFLFGSGQLLLHHPPLFALIDEWVAGLEWEDFEQVVALLRRTFSDFSRYDRRKLMEMVEGDQSMDPPESPDAQPIAEQETLLADLLRWIA